MINERQKLRDARCEIEDQNRARRRELVVV